MSFDIKMTTLGGPAGTGTISITNASDADGDFSGGAGTGTFAFVPRHGQYGWDSLDPAGHFTISPGEATINAGGGV